MTQRQTNEALRQVVLTAERILSANGFQIVTMDDRLFPNDKPALAGLKNGRLLVFIAKAYNTTDQFLNPDQIDSIRDQLDTMVAADRPYTDPRVKEVDRVALVLVPGDITIVSPEGDIKWVVVESADELPEEMDKVLGWTY